MLDFWVKRHWSLRFGVSQFSILAQTSAAGLKERLPEKVGIHQAESLMSAHPPSKAPLFLKRMMTY
jgi:hypothetical protein